MTAVQFRYAAPVWETGMEKEKSAILCRSFRIKTIVFPRKTALQDFPLINPFAPVNTMKAENAAFSAE